MSSDRTPRSRSTAPSNEVPPDYIGARVDLRFPVGRPQDIVLYRDDHPVGPVKPVDVVDNARFHAPPVELSYAELVRRRQEEEEAKP